MIFTRLPFVLAVLSAIPLAAADRLFVFYEESTSAVVLDAPSLAPRGSVAVPRGAFSALRAGANVYVIASDRVAVFDGALEPGGEILLSEDAATAVAVDPHASQLLVAAGPRLYRIDTQTNRIASVLEVGGAASALYVPRDGRLAYWMTSGSRQVRVIDLASSLVLPGTSDLAAVPDAFAEGLIGAGSEVFTAAASLGGAAGRTSPTGAPASLLAASASGARLLRSSNALLLAAPDGSVITPLDSSAFAGSPLLHSALAPDGGAAYLALEDGRIVAMDAKGERPPATAWAASAPSALSLVANPSQGGPSIVLTKVSGDGQAVVENTEFDIVVRADFAGGVEMTVQSNSPAAQCDDVPVLIGSTNVTITCTANSVDAPATVTLTVAAPLLDLSAAFTVYVFPEGLQDGLFIVSGDNQTVNAGASFSLVVEARLNGLPRTNFPITVTDSSAVLNCPAIGLTTNAAGRATINCTVAGSVPVSETATINVSDGASNTVAFTANIVGQSNPNDSLVRITPDPVTVFEGQGFNLTVEARLNGAPRANVLLAVTENSPAIICPTSALTGGAGQATIACGSNQVSADVTTQVSISDGSRTVTYSITVKNATVVNGLQKVSGDDQVVAPNTQFPQPLIVRAVTNGEPDDNLLLAVTVSNAAATCPVGTLTDTNGLASITCTAGTVAIATEVEIQVKDAANRMLSEPFTATVTPSLGGDAEDILIVSGANLAARAGDTLPGALQVRVEDADNKPVSGASVFPRGPEGVTFTPTVAQSNLNGLAVFDVSFACPPATGQIQLGLTSSSTEATANYTRTAGPLNQLRKLQGDNQAGVPGQLLPLALLIESADQCGAILPSIPLTWSVVPPEAAALEGVISTTNPQGRASVRVLPSTRGGAYQVRAVSTQNPNVAATFALTTQNAATQLQIVSGNQQSVPAGSQSANPLVVRALSAASQPVQGVTVSFQVTSGSGAVGSTSVVTDAQGRASTTFTGGQARGPVNVRATGAGQTVNFTLTIVGGIPQLQVAGFVNGASFLPGFVAGSTGSIFGVNITEGLTGPVSAPYTPGVGFPTEFRGVRVTVGGIVAPILSLANVNGQEQINIQVPFGLAQGTVTVLIENNGAQASIAGIPVFGVQPGVFEYYLGAQRYAAVLHANFDLVTPANPARPGEVVLLFLTGLGRVTPPVATNQPGPVSPLSTTVQQPIVSLNGAAQEVQGSYYAPQLHTVYQINFRVGANTQPGSRTLVVSMEGSNSQQTTLPVGAAF